MALPKAVSYAHTYQQGADYVKAKIIPILLSLSLIFAGTALPASAGIVTTRDAMALDLRVSQVSAVQASLAREDVRAAFVALGVDPEQASARVEALSDAELSQLQRQIDQLPAGGSALALVGAVFVVLMILEFTGVIDIFKKV